MAAWICSGVASDVTGSGEGGGDGYFGGPVDFVWGVVEGDPGEEMGTEKWEVDVDVGWERRISAINAG